MEDRKPLIVLGILALVAILLFVFGVFGARRPVTESAWPQWATPSFSSGDQLTTADLREGSSCQFAGQAITFTGVCQLEVRKVTGGFPWEKATRRAVLTAAGQAVGVTVTITLDDDNEKNMQTALDPGEDVRLTYTREGGKLGLACGTPGGCTVVLSKDA